MQDDLPVRLVALNDRGDEIRTIVRTSDQLLGIASFESYVERFPNERWMLLLRARIMRRHNCE